jgi:hypothetical protein
MKAWEILGNLSRLPNFLPQLLDLYGRVGTSPRLWLFEVGLRAR